MATPYSPGLEGVTAGISAISEVDAERNALIYRGYDIHDLVEHCTFEEVAYLLLYGELPTTREYAAFRQTVVENRNVPEAVLALYRQFPPDTHPMDALRAAVALLAILDPDRHDHSHEANRRKAVRLFAQMPVLVVNGYRILQGQEPITPDPERDHNASFFYLLTGQSPPDLFLRVFNVTQILYAEHGFNASTFAARVTVSTLSDLHSGVVSAIGTLKGPLHGGANEAAMAMLLEIGQASRAAEWVHSALAQKRKIMGFGHREYKRGDERARIVKRYATELGEALGDTRWAEISQVVEDVMLQTRRLYPNLDFPVASAYYLMGIPVPLYTPIFVMSRITGWCAHIMEQLENNRIIRPHSEYNGPRGRKVLPLASRT
ncbi:MAG: citrate/2-methylcitrate synthase [Chloroherpetonaceae bacterium]|nr:citrate synthase [Chthonomonadaceae bacterium]MDW8208064.1 citrate/2-methylcitrate synthase [Chloroherpetonaceae bacterium]